MATKESLNAQITKYQNALNKIDDTILKLKELSNKLSNTENFIGIEKINKAIDYADDTINDLGKTKINVEDAISDAISKIRNLDNKEVRMVDLNE